MVMTFPLACHPGSFLMKNMNPKNSGLKVCLPTLILLTSTSSAVHNGYHHSIQIQILVAKDLIHTLVYALLSIICLAT